MGDETKAHVFEPFFTTKPTGEGTGLGLATVYGIVMQNKGFLDVQSKLGQGTLFTMYLPVCEDSENTQNQTVTSAGVYADNNDETILLVEDEPAIIDLGMKILSRLKYKVLPAASPSEAVRLANEHPGEIELLITDVIMPEMNGRDLADKLLTLFPNMKCLFMSGYTADIITHQGVLDDDVNFLHKPFSIKGLDSAVRKALGKE